MRLFVIILLTLNYIFLPAQDIELTKQKVTTYNSSSETNDKASMTCIYEKDQIYIINKNYFEFIYVMKKDDLKKTLEKFVEWSSKAKGLVFNKDIDSFKVLCIFNDRRHYDKSLGVTFRFISDKSQYLAIVFDEAVDFKNNFITVKEDSCLIEVDQAKEILLALSDENIAKLKAKAAKQKEIAESFK